MLPVRPRAGAKRREDSAGSTCPLSPCSPAASLPLDPEAGGALLPAPPTWRAPPAGRGLPSETRARASRRGQARATPAPSSRCDFQDPQKSAPLAPWRLCSGFLGPDPLLRPRLQQRPEMQPLVSCHPVCRRPRTSREPPLAPAPSCKRVRRRGTGLGSARGRGWTAWAPAGRMGVCAGSWSARECGERGDERSRVRHQRRTGECEALNAGRLEAHGNAGLRGRGGTRLMRAPA